MSEQTAEYVRSLERIRDELMSRFTTYDAEFTLWVLELLSIVETALAAQTDGDGCAT